MYELDNGKCYDSQYFTDWASTVHIKSSMEAAIVWRKLENDGVLLLEKENGDKKRLGNHEWARLCIAYCFAKIPAIQWEKPKDANGTEVPSFNTLFNQASKTGEEKFWLTYISQRLFEDNSQQLNSKRELVSYIQDAWHNGAVGLWQRYQKALVAYDNNIVEAKKILFSELAELAKQPRVLGGQYDVVTSRTGTPIDAQCDQLKEALDKTIGGGSVISSEYSGVRYNCFCVQFDHYVDLEKSHSPICSELGISDDAMRCERIQGAAHTWHIKILRNENTWQQFGKAEFQAALSRYPVRDQSFKLPILIGVDERGEPIFQDFSTAPHVIVGGETGAGKTVFLLSMLLSLFELSDDQETEVAMIYCKMATDFSALENYSNLWEKKLISEPETACEALQYFTEEMDRRYQLLDEYHVQSRDELPAHLRFKRTVIVIDELADLIDTSKAIEPCLVRLAQKARAADIHLLLATQRPDAETLAGRLRDNLNTKIALKVGKRQASEIILGERGAEKIAAKGDHLVKWSGGKLYFLHGFNV